MELDFIIVPKPHGSSFNLAHGAIFPNRPAILSFTKTVLSYFFTGDRTFSLFLRQTLSSAADRLYFQLVFRLLVLGIFINAFQHAPSADTFF